jgi:F-type H+-transporting ATPase subunit epsilon
MLFEIVTAERLVSSEEADVVVAPGAAGELAILPHHAPLLTSLRPGEIRMVQGKEESFIAVSGGFMEVLANKVTILADTAERADEIDLQRTEEALKRAQEEIASAASDQDLSRALASMRRSQARMKVARRRRRGPPRSDGPPAG